MEAIKWQAVPLPRPAEHDPNMRVHDGADALLAIAEDTSVGGRARVFVTSLVLIRTGLNWFLAGGPGPVGTAVARGAAGSETVLGRARCFRPVVLVRLVWRVMGLRQLQQSLQYADHLDMSDAVVERLAQAAPDRPLEAVQSVALLVDTVSEPWTLRHWLADIGAVLRAAINSADSAARGSALELIDELGRRGYHDYRDLRLA